MTNELTTMDFSEMERLCRESGGLMPETQIKLIAVARAAKDSDIYSRHVEPCRHEYRGCTCGREELVKALEAIDD